ncbi:MAG TPA: ferritin-like domain-containing protein, partial [Vicinamibacterales bacterium]|nr:ferritin-like domain-containing protein [Vicinamibacterales bacterium]
SAPSQPTGDENRPAQIDHYEINQRWQDLAIVLRGRELEGAYQVGEAETANPLPSPDSLGETLVELATLEHAVALEYLYARYSLKSSTETADKRLADDLVFVRHELLLIAVSEMRHLRWANQLLWSLEHDGMLTKKLGPSLGVATEIPRPAAAARPQLPVPKVASPAMRPRELRPLEPAVLADFVAVEQPSGFLDGQYSRVLATLRQKAYRPTLEQLAARIIGEGMEHFSRFREIQVVLRKRQPTEYLRGKYVLGATSDPAVGRALATYRSILAELAAAYDQGDMEDAAHIARARALMFDLDSSAEELGRNGTGIPFFVSPATTKVAATKRLRSRGKKS